MLAQKVKLSSIHPGERYSMLPPGSHDAYTFIKTAQYAALLLELSTRIDFEQSEANSIDVYALDRPASDAATTPEQDVNSAALGDWIHYKRGRVKVLGLATDDASGLEMAYFFVESTNSYWIRPVRDFYETVDGDGGVPIRRFVRVE